MNPRPRILVLTPDQPFPSRGGGQMRMTSILPMLSKAGRVHIACALPQIEAETEKWAQAEAMTIEAAGETLPGPWRQSFERISAVAAQSNLRFRPRLFRRLDEVCRRFGPDLVWLETPYLVRYALRWSRRVPVVADYWGTSEGPRRLLRLSRGRERFLAWLHWRCALGGERRYAPRLQAIACVSAEDAAFFKSLAPACTVWVIPNAIRLDRSDGEIASGTAAAPRMIFTGDMSFGPNIDAARYFTSEIFPSIRAAVPEAQLVLAGRDPHPKVQALAAAAGVTVTGGVPSLAAEIARSAVYVLPMRLGSGIRTKLFEVFPLEVPIVTTSIGAEGLALQHERNCRVADSASEFADACIRLLNSDAERRRLGHAMRKTAMATYSQEAVGRMVQSIVEETLKNGTGSQARPLHASVSVHPHPTAPRAGS